MNIHYTCSIRTSKMNFLLQDSSDQLENHTTYPPNYKLTYKHYKMIKTGGSLQRC